MRKKQPDRWTTLDETNFLRGLGTWGSATTLPRKKLLENYITSARKRNKWEGVDKSSTIRCAEGRLRAL